MSTRAALTLLCVFTFVFQLAVVSQNPELFSESVRYNIGYGLEGCGLERVEEAAEKANIHHVISGLEDKYNTGANTENTDT